MPKNANDIRFMQKALYTAQQGMEEGEVPIGAVIVANNQFITCAHNQVEKLQDATAHAEMIAITAACHHFGNKYLQKCTLYVTLTPCSMCAGAFYWTKIGRIVLGATSHHNHYQTYSPTFLHPKTQVTTGILAEKCQQLLHNFFQFSRMS